MEQCANMNHPYLSESSSKLMITKDEENDAILTCMLEHVMSTAPANDFGFNNPPAVCKPLAFDNMGVICIESLAKPAYDKGTENKDFFEIINEDIALNGKVQQYMSMSMSMD
jgi:hypothetical protein